MSLLGLPTEVLQNIIARTMPKGFESLVLSCKTIFEAGELFISTHNALRRRYRQFSLDNEIQSSMQLVQRIAHQPLIADYIEIADLYHENDFEDGIGNISDSLSDHAIRELVVQSTYLNQAGISPEDWLSCMVEDHSDDSSSTFLLTLLPNTVELTLPRQWESFSSPYKEEMIHTHPYRSLWTLLDVIAQESRKGPDRSLSKLRRLHPFAEPGYDERAALQTLNPFLGLPSIRELSTTSCIAVDDGYTGKPFNWRYPEIDSNLEKVELAHCCISGSQLANFLKHTPILRSFKLVYETKWHGCGHDWDAHEVIATLGRHCGKSLTELSITIEAQYGTLKGGVSSLKDFTALEHLELDSRFFFGPPVTEELRDMDPEEYRAYAYSTGWNATSVPSLVDMLPPSIRSVLLVAGLEREDPVVLKRLVADFDGRRAENVPLLDSMKIHRATARLGGLPVESDQDSAVWDSVGEMVTSAGFKYKESSNVHASWLDNFHLQYQRR